IGSMETREVSPAHFVIKIESFSLLDKCGIKKYETNEFVAGEYKWKLIIYPNGDDDENNADYISIYLAMVGTSTTSLLPANWEVNAVFNILILNQSSGNYLFSGGARRFQAMKLEWGFSKFISKEILLDPTNGYLINDNCVFGAEVFVVKSESAATECLSLKNVVIPYTHDWNITNFSKLENSCALEEFVVGGHNWSITLCPRGWGELTDRCVIVLVSYIGSVNYSSRVKACCTVSIKNQVNNNHAKKTGTQWFTATKRHFACGLTNVTNPNKGFIVNDCCLLNLEMSIEAVVR
ncbi:hypothetical protein MIMGU_mgv1a026270mg, partial [Erythranthe guttata]